jgi:CBS domain-containing protein
LEKQRFFNQSFRKFISKLSIMNRISDILSRKGHNAISVSPNTSVLDALKVMADNNIGSVVVKEDEKFAGIVTERDYSRKVILKGKNSTDTHVSEIMTTDFPDLKPSDTVEHCMELMTKNNIRYLPVFDEKKLAGIISISDVVKETILSQQQTIDHLHDYIHS